MRLQKMAIKRAPKAAGTRAGTLLDWRQGSTKSGKVSRRRENSVRDGR